MFVTVASVGSFATKTVTAWTLAITLSSAPNSTKYYEFDTETECRQVQPFVTEMYLAMGETEVNTKCSETVYGIPETGAESQDAKPLPSSMIL